MSLTPTRLLVALALLLLLAVLATLRLRPTTHAWRWCMMLLVGFFWYNKHITKKPLGLQSQWPLLTTTCEETHAWLTTILPYLVPAYET